MKLESVTLKNFRAFREATTLRLDDLTAIIGQNDVGKSSLLHALEIFFNNQTVKVDAADRNVYAADQPIEITCEFSGLPERLVIDAQAETSLEDEYLVTAERKLRIKKRISPQGKAPKTEVFVCARHPTAEHFDNLLELTQTNLRKRLDELDVSADDVRRNSNVSMRRAIWDACEDLRLADVEVPIAKTESKKIWDQLQQYLPLYALFKSDRESSDADDEVQNPMKFAIAVALAKPEVRQMLQTVTDAVKLEAVDLANRTCAVLAALDKSLGEQLVPDFKADPKWPGIFSLLLNGEDGVPMNKRGSGIRRMILLGFFRADAERRATESSSTNVIYAIEEPETSQHPSNQRLLLESFESLASESGCQVILTTHSPGFANLLPYECFRFVDRSQDGTRIVKHVDEEVLGQIVESLGVMPDNRVQVLLCVEGPNDITSLTCLSRVLHAVDPSIPNLEEDHRIAFVPLGGGTLEHWVNKRWLREFGRPEIHIYDRDDTAKYQEAVDAINARTDESWATLTDKRAMENYLHPQAIHAVLGVTIAIDDECDVPAVLADQTRRNKAKLKTLLANRAFPEMRGCPVFS